MRFEEVLNLVRVFDWRRVCTHYFHITI